MALFPAKASTGPKAPANIKEYQMDGIASQAIDLLVVGMGTVFSFLALLILATSLMSRFIGLVSRPENLPPSASSAPTPTPPNMEDQQLIAVISAALHKHRSRKH
jgi:oxaloacetate decarboxylase gamma subunit